MGAGQGEGLGQLHGGEAALVAPANERHYIHAVALQVVAREARVVHVGDLCRERSVAVERKVRREDRRILAKLVDERVRILDELLEFGLVFVEHEELAIIN